MIFKYAGLAQIKEEHNKKVEVVGERKMFNWDQTKKCRDLNSEGKV